MESNALERLGLTAMEAEVYRHLVVSGSGTGYAVARGVGKPAANTYKALESLVAKGMALEGAGRARRYRAVPIDEVLDGLTARFEADRHTAREELAAVTPQDDTAGVYRLRSRPQVIARLMELVNDAADTILIEAPVPVLETVERELAAAGVRGVAVLVATEPEWAEPGVDVIVRGNENAGRVCAVRDRNTVLLATMEDGRVAWALFSQDPGFAAIQHRLLAGELFHAAIARGFEGGITTDEVEDAFELVDRFR